MASKFMFVALVITLAFVNGREISNLRPNHELVNTEKESRIIDIPLIGGIVFLVFQVVGLVISKIWWLVEYKLAALSAVANLTSWLTKHHILVILAIAGVVAVAGLCLVTGIFSAEPVYEIEHLVRAVRSLDQGVVKYIVD